MSKTAGAKSTPGLTEKEQADYNREWVDPIEPKTTEEALHKLMLRRAVRALATPNSERLAQLFDKLSKMRWKVGITKEVSSAFRKPGRKETA